MLSFGPSGPNKNVLNVGTCALRFFPSEGMKLGVLSPGWRMIKIVEDVYKRQILL